jgi:hypothetical protein
VKGFRIWKGRLSLDELAREDTLSVVLDTVRGFTRFFSLQQKRRVDLVKRSIIVPFFNVNPQGDSVLFLLRMGEL